MSFDSVFVVDTVYFLLKAWLLGLGFGFVLALFKKGTSQWTN